MIYTIVSIFISFLLTLQVFFVVYKIAKSNREERINYVKNFNKGKFLLVYVLALPLMLIAFLYDGIKFLPALFSAVDRIGDLVLLNFKFDGLINLMEQNVYYQIAVYYVFFLVCLNVVMVGVSFLGQIIFESKKALFFKFSNKDKTYIFGNNEDNLTIYFSDKNKNSVIIDNLDKDKKFELYVQNVYYLNCKIYEIQVDKTFNEALFKSNTKVNVVINTKNDELNVKLCKLFITKIKNINDNYDIFKKLNLFVYGSPLFETLYEEIEGEAKGCIKYINKYKLIANDFIKNYPLALFLDSEQVDYTKATVSKDVDINFNLIGFGQTGLQIFLSTLSNNQFIEEVDGNISIKKVNYHIYDKNGGESSKNLNHSYFRYINEFKDVDLKDYLPLPEVPANQTFYKLDINDTSFYSNLKKSTQANKNSVNFIVVCFASDLENIDMAKKLKAKMYEWGSSKTYIFVKIRNSVNNYLIEKIDNAYVIGNEDKIVYNVDKILDNEITSIAILRNAIYDLEYAIINNEAKTITKKEYQNTLEKSYREWYSKKSAFERGSSYGSSLSIRGKLNLMGYDLNFGQSNLKISKKEFFAHYQKDDEVVYNDKLKIDNKKVVVYDIEKFKPSLRFNLAFLEHLRWNAYMICNGFIPATIDEILNEVKEVNGKIKHTNGKNYQTRKHGNLTTFEGLLDYSKLISKRDNISLNDADVIRYDYQLLDDVYYLIDSLNLSIIKK